jgi:hypothetical protein
MKLAFSDLAGNVTIIGAASKQDLERTFGPMTDAQYRAHVIDRNIAKGIIPVDATLVDLPDDWTPPDGNRAYRAAWKLNGSKVEVDMPKARAIHMNYIRRARDKKLAELDPLWMKATGQKKAVEADAIEAQRQKLRDIPQTLDLSQAATPDDLKAIWPAELA